MPSPVISRRLYQPRSKLLAEYAVNGFFGGITTSRATDLWLPNASGTLIEYTSGNVGIVDGDAVWCQPEATNLVDYSVDMSAFYSTTYQGTENSTTGDAPDGTSTFTEVEDDTAGGLVLVERNMGTGDGISFANGSSYCYSLFFKKNASATHYAGMRLNFGPATAVIEAVVINLTNGTIAAEINSGGTYGVEDYGDFFRVWLSVTNTNASNSQLRVMMWPAYNTDGSTSASNAAQGATQFGFAQVEAGTYPTSYIPTSGSTDAAGPTESVIPWPNGLDSNFAGSFVWTPAAASQGTIWLLGNYTDADNAFGVLHNGTNIIFRNRVSGSNNDATKALAYSADTEYLIHFRHDSLTGLDIAVDRTKGTNDSTTTAVTSAANCEVGSDGNTANHTIGKVKEIKIQKTYPGFSDAAWLAL